MLIDRTQKATLTSDKQPEKIFLGDFFFRKHFATRPNKNASSDLFSKIIST